MKLGIDPGQEGAIAFLYDDLQVMFVTDMPTMQLGLKAHQVNAAELTRIIHNGGNNSNVTVYLEQVSAMPGNGSVSMFNFGMSYGVVQGIVAALGYPLILVRPNAWKKAAGLIGKPKDASRTLMQQIYPSVDLSLKKHNGRSDALCIARFGGIC